MSLYLKKRSQCHADLLLESTLATHVQHSGPWLQQDISDSLHSFGFSCRCLFPMVLSLLADISSPHPPLSQGSMLLVRTAREAGVRQASQPVLVFSESSGKLFFHSSYESSGFSYLPARLLQGLLGFNHCSSKRPGWSSLRTACSRPLHPPPLADTSRKCFGEL